MSSEEEFQSTRSLFESAEENRHGLEASPEPSTFPSNRLRIEKALAQYARTIEQAAAVSLFSPNEGVEDVATTALPYMLAEFYIAELVQRLPVSEPGPGGLQERVQILRRAREAYERFLNLVDGYGLVTGAYTKMLERYRDDEDAFEAVAAGSGDAAAKRDGKIASFRAEKELKQKLALLKADPRYLESGDEEVVRELYLTNVTFAIHSTFQALDSLNREMQILAQAPTSALPLASDDRFTNTTNKITSPSDMDSSRLDGPLHRNGLGRGGPILSQKGKPLQPFTLLGSRADIARGVFRSGHNLPTMSIDEYLAEERRRGNIIEGGGQEQAKPAVDEDDMEAADLATYKARAWDDYKDDNPRGSGNTMNMG